MKWSVSLLDKFEYDLRVRYYKHADEMQVTPTCVPPVVYSDKVCMLLYD